MARIALGLLSLATRTGGFRLHVGRDPSGLSAEREDTR